MQPFTQNWECDDWYAHNNNRAAVVGRTPVLPGRAVLAKSYDDVPHDRFIIGGARRHCLTHQRGYHTGSLLGRYLWCFPSEEICVWSISRSQSPVSLQHPAGRMGTDDTIAMREMSQFSDIRCGSQPWFSPSSSIWRWTKPGRNRWFMPKACRILPLYSRRMSGTLGSNADIAILNRQSYGCWRTSTEKWYALKAKMPPWMSFHQTTSLKISKVNPRRMHLTNAVVQLLK